MKTSDRKYPDILFTIANGDEKFLKELKYDYKKKNGISYFTLHNNFSTNEKIEEIIKQLWEARIPVIQSQEAIKKNTSDALVPTIK
ncbi:MAG: hypothetical protein LBP53_08200 [Candidatus Peribacteria bacterium]|nr:hypothetical protein [Candidatus Peribacteria bacterium]